MAATATAVPRRSIFRHSGVRHMPALFTAVSCAIVAVIVFLALFGWLVEPHDPAAQDLFDAIDSKPDGVLQWIRNHW